VSELLTNGTTSPLTVNYAFRTTDNTGCTNSQLIQATVNPIASLTSGLSPLPICSNTIFNYTPSANVTGTIFSWTRGVFGTNAANSGNSNGGNPGEVLVNVNTTALALIIYIHCKRQVAVSTPKRLLFQLIRYRH
jgi:hypothetical protein